MSITYDGGTINQFDVAMPIMDELGLPATFFIVTGDIAGSEYGREFIGRSVEEIAAEVVGGVPTTEANFFERAGAARMLPFDGAVDYHTRAGDLYELGRVEEAHAEIEAAFRNADSLGSRAPAQTTVAANPDVDATWDDLRAYAGRGHEFASHSVSHAQLSILDDANLVYELERSRDEILRFLGPEHTFSVEGPYGTENERVMEKAFAIYPATRNRMPADYLEEINRWNDVDPAASEKEYVQWQRGPKSATPLEQMQSWVDTALLADNIWLVLVFHGVEGVGWEPTSAADLEAYFRYIAGKEELWVATFRDVTRYMRERMAAEVTTERSGEEIRVSLTHSLDPQIYDLPLTLTTTVPDRWRSVEVVQDGDRRIAAVDDSAGVARVSYEAVPNAGTVALREAAG